MRLLLVLGALLVILCFLPSTTQGASFGTISSLRVRVQLQSSGAVLVRQDINYPAASTLDWQLLSGFKKLAIEANGKRLSHSEIKQHRNGQSTQLLSNVTASNWIISYIATSNLIRHDDRDQLFFKVFQESGIAIDNVDIDFFLPEPPSAEGLGGNLYAIGGVSNPQTTVVATDHIRYQTGFSAGLSLVTINASWPKSVLRLNLIQELRLRLINLDVLPWLILGLSLPLVSLVILIRLLLRQRKDDAIIVKDERSTPPSNLAPILVGVLVKKKLNPEVITALIIDFCRRGYAVIVKKNDQYFLGRRKPADEHLEDWERNLLTELFPSAGILVTDSQLRLINRQSLFSPRVHTAFGRIYQVITEKLFFAENPHVTRVRYKLIGLTLYFTGVIGLVWAAIANTSSYLLIPLIGTIIMAWLIIRLTPKLIHYTAAGKTARAEWLAFGNFLGSRQALPPEASRNQTFEQYLPYAVALHQTSRWAQRFDRSTALLIRPDWFVMYRELSAQQFVSEMIKFSKSLSAILASMRGPLVN